MNEQLALDSPQDKTQVEGPVKCFGMTFENDEKRREYFLEKLREKLQDPEFRQIEGFPTGSDEDILTLSDPPYYTACPNPFLKEFIEYWGIAYNSNEEYHRQPFASDVNEGKGGKIYKAHTFHTKVPHEAITRYILHYTQPGDIVLDVFAGSGMTGVAAAYCGAPEVKFKKAVEEVSSPIWGERRAILVDLSPFATFVSHNMITHWSPSEFTAQAHRLINDTRKELPKSIYGDPCANYLIWSQVLHCPECGREFDFGKVAISNGVITPRFVCPDCSAEITKSHSEAKHITLYDEFLGQPVVQNEYRPIWIVRQGHN
jgi:hypothetical protein